MTLRDDREGFLVDAPVRRAHGSRLRRGLWAVLLAGIGGRLQTGKLTVETPSGEQLVFGGKSAGPTASLQIHRWRSLRRLILGAQHYCGRAILPDVGQLHGRYAFSVKMGADVAGAHGAEDGVDQGM